MVTKKVERDPFEDEEEPEEDEEAMMEEEEEEHPIQRPMKRPMEVARTNKFAPQPKPVAEDRFVAVHSPAVDGIMDKQTNKLVTVELWEALAKIISSQQRIEESLG